MRTTDERMTALKQRSKELEQIKKTNNNRLIALSSVVVCFVVIIFTAFSMPNLMARLEINTYENLGAAASMFSNMDVRGYLLIGFLAFLLGVSVTILCVHLHRRNKEDGSDD
ncbi:MAG: DUF4179 domain-containing protein [Oscillospiraceae bacterium]